MYRVDRLAVCGAAADSQVGDSSERPMSSCRRVNEGASQFLDELGVQRSHVAIHNWVHKADLQPISTVSANQLAVDEKVIRVRLNKIIVDGCPIDDLLLLLGTEVNSNSQILSNPCNDVTRDSNML